MENEAGISKNSQFDVFLSFRGKDTRNGFTSHLHKELEQRGISAFIDSEGLEKGQNIKELFKYIEESSIFLPIFSRNYADSKWCLMEITKMVEVAERDGRGRKIIPVFFDVPPSDVKNQRGSFEAAFRGYQDDQELGEEKVNHWRQALRRAGDISGYCLLNTDGNEAKLTTLIGKQVSTILSKVPFDIQPVGIISCINDVIEMLETAISDVSVIGICGQGGIGKTTMAMAIYNRLCPDFEGTTCFLSDVRENAKKHGLPFLQAKLMHDITGDYNILLDNVKQGISLIKRRTKFKQVLLILDDVDHIEQLQAFIPTRKVRLQEEWFGAGSKIIITTRDKEVLLKHGLKDEAIFFPKELDYMNSLQLFSRHAFVSDQPIPEFNALSKEVVKVTGGLPLALVVFGSLFYDRRDKQVWERTLKRLADVQHEDVHQKLKISYEALDQEEKCIFLDIACFFVQQKAEYPIYMWEECGYHPLIALEFLQHKSLVKIDKKGKFLMHDQIRDMGRRIVREEGNFDPWTCTRLWERDGALLVLKDVDLPKNYFIQGIFLNANQCGDGRFSVRAFSAMARLRMLHIEGDMNLGEDESVDLPSSLKYLRWDKSGLQAVRFGGQHHDKLVLLNLSRGRFTNLHLVNMVFPHLKVLDLTGCNNLISIPDFANFPCLMKLVLDSCSSLSEVGDSIQHLKKLTFLSMAGCWSLRRLSPGVCELTLLEFLDIHGCRVSHLPELLGHLKSLKHLNLGETLVVDIPDSIGGLECLEVLQLGSCCSLRRLPDSIGGLKNLHELDLRGNRLLEQLPTSIGMLSSLEKLILHNCETLLELNDSLETLTSLRELSLQNCKSLKCISGSIGGLRNLQKLSLAYCKSLQDLPDPIGRLESLVDLDFSSCTSLRKLHDSFGNLKSLKSLKMWDCHSLEEYPDSLGDLESLEVLYISIGDSLRKVPDFVKKLKNLRELDLFHSRDADSDDVCSHDTLPQLPSSLAYLNISDYASLKKTPDISNLKYLIHLTLNDCRNITDVPGLESLQFLRHLDLLGCESLSCDMINRLSLASFRHLQYLRCSGIHVGSNLLFGIPSGYFPSGSKLSSFFYLTSEREMQSNPYLMERSQIDVCVQIIADGEMICQGTCEAKKREQGGYGIIFEPDCATYSLARIGRVVMQVATTYHGYQLSRGVLLFMNNKLRW